MFPREFSRDNTRFPCRTRSRARVRFFLHSVVLLVALLVALKASRYASVDVATSIDDRGRNFFVVGNERSIVSKRFFLQFSAMSSEETRECDGVGVTNE